MFTLWKRAADYLNLLDEDGLLVMTRWLQTPPSESARLFGMMAQALEEKGLDPDAASHCFPQFAHHDQHWPSLKPFDEEAYNNIAAISGSKRV